jgi:hypothetical protein
VATLVSGMDGLLREPSGCFEQTSSTNYPNVMVLDYLRTNDVADPALVERASGMLDRGYKKLVGFETAQKGYEWFGQAPAHEALTAYGLVQFTDMKRITGVGDDEMMARTAKYLETRRDGQGGYLRDRQGAGLLRARQPRGHRRVHDVGPERGRLHPVRPGVRALGGAGPEDLG